MGTSVHVLLATQDRDVIPISMSVFQILVCMENAWQVTYECPV